MDQQPVDDGSVLRGTVERVTFHNPSNGYSVMQVVPEDGSGRITVVGNCAAVREGSLIIAQGRYITHPKFGRQFQTHSITESAPSTSEGIERYLASGIVPGMGKKTAQKLTELFGERTIETIMKEPERIAKVPGLGKKKADAIVQAFQERSDFQETLRFMIEHGISANLAARLYERYRQKTMEMVSRNPYLLAREFRGVGFVTADDIAKKLGLPIDSPERIMAGIEYALESAADDGNCLLPFEKLLERSAKLLELGERDLLERGIEGLLGRGRIVRHGERIFLTPLDKAEAFVADFIQQRLQRSERPLFDPAKIQDALEKCADELRVTFSPEQAAAVNAVAHNRFVVITGGPGCGKTTIIRALVKLFELSAIRFALAAPTGRAAQRMSSVCMSNASTIHRLLKFDPQKNSFLHGVTEPFELDALIIDEASMIDIVLAKDLFSALPTSCSLILVGDKDQLPSVGPGRLFGDLVGCHLIKTIALSKLFRRAEESRITTVAYEINSGERPDIPAPDGQTKSDAYFIAKDAPEECARLVVSLVAEQIPRKFGFSGNDVAVLTPANRGPLGTHELNRLLQERLNPSLALDASRRIVVGAHEFRAGDRVCQRVNNYKIDPAGVFNGDTGTIVDVDSEGEHVTVELWDGRLIRYDRGDLGQLALAYAVTVHRSQGTEIPCVVLALDTSHFTLLERQLLYTAVTRAKKLLIIVGAKRALLMACKRTTSNKRGTMLGERLLGEA